MRSELAKVLHRAGGRPLLEHVIRACQPLKPAQLLAVVGHQAEAVGQVAASLGGANRFAAASARHRHAMQIARRAIRNRAKIAVVLPGDAPLLRTQTLAALDRHAPPRRSRRHHSQRRNRRSHRLRPHRSRRAGPRCRHRRREKRYSRAARHSRSQFQHLLLHARQTLARAQRSAPGKRPSRALSHRRDRAARERNERVLAQIAPDPREILGCNTRVHLADVDRIFRARKAARNHGCRRNHLSS